MTEKQYYSARAGRGPRANPTLHDLYRVLVLTVDELHQREYLQEWFGKDCVDDPDDLGRAGVDIRSHIERTLGYRDVWPLSEHDPYERFDDPQNPEEAEVVHGYVEDLVFDLIEYFHDHVSEGIESTGSFHDYAGCGWHYKDFSTEPAQAEFRSRLAPVLANYSDGYRLTSEGSIEHAGPEGLTKLVDTPLLTDDADIQARVESAIRLWRNRTRTIDDLRLAVRELFDVLEKLRPQLKSNMLKGDESDLFNIANNFTIRHMREGQKGDYGPLWLSWMFYVNLATVHLITRLGSNPQRFES